jgi:hypothetical protein
VHLRDANSKSRWVSVHSLVLITFVGPRPPGMFGCHNNGNALDNRVENLRWDTPKGNKADDLKHGVTHLGSRNGFAKLNEELVVAIRRRVACGESQSSIARELGISQTTISLIVLRKTWAHVA